MRPPTKHYSEYADDDLIYGVMNNVTKEIAQMPSHMIIKKSDVGIKWCITENWSVEPALLINEAVGESKLLHKMFTKV